MIRCYARGRDGTWFIDCRNGKYVRVRGHLYSALARALVRRAIGHDDFKIYPL